MRVAFLLPLLVLAGTASAQETVLLRGAKVFTGTGAFQDGVEVLLQGGKIAKVGPSITPPAGAKVLELEGRWLTPGLVDPNTSLGLDQAHVNEESDEVTPHIPILEAVSPRDQSFRRALEDGVTTAYVSPGGKNVFGGLGVVLKTQGETLAKRVLDRGNGMRMTLGSMPTAGNRTFRGGNPDSMFYRRPTTRMGVIWEIRSAFYDADARRASGDREELEDDPKVKTLIAALDQKLVVRTTARTDQDIRTALRLAQEFGLKLALDECTEAWLNLDQLAAAGFPVICAPPSVETHPDNAEPHLDTIKLLADKGVKVAIQTGQGLGALPLIREAAFAVRRGLPRERALEAVTSVPADILGVADRVGRIAEGLDADLVVWNLHPLSVFSKAETVIVDGFFVIRPAQAEGSPALESAGTAPPSENRGTRL
ncbi:MAG: amidohydrolase family protein [Planctomycetota bacterium]